MNEKMIQFPQDYKVPAEPTREVSSEAEIQQLPDHIKASVETPVIDANGPEVTEVPVSQESIGQFQLPHLALGSKALEIAIHSVPGVESTPTAESGTPVNGPREKVVIGGLDEWKGGNPNPVPGFKDR